MENTFDYPLVFTGDITNITDTSATFTAKVTNLGKYTILESGFVWSLYHNNNNGIKLRNEKTLIGVYSLKTNEKLLPGKTYYVRAYIQNESSVTYGRELTFQTPEKNVNPGKWIQIFDYPISTDWSEGCEIISTYFTINDSTYVIFNDGEMYCYSHIANTLKYITTTSFLYPEAGFSVVYNGYVYVFSMNVFYRFDPKALSFSKLNVIGQDQVISGASGFLYGDNIYVGIGSAKEYWKYNISSDTWNRVSSFPGDSRYDSYAFAINNIGYIGSRINTEAWNYDPENDNWIRKENSPFTGGIYHSSTNTMIYGYCFYNHDLYEYNPIFDIWEKRAHLTSEGNICDPRMFTLRGEIYLINIWNSNHTDHFNLWVYEK